MKRTPHANQAASRRALCVQRPGDDVTDRVRGGSPSRIATTTLMILVLGFGVSTRPGFSAEDRSHNRPNIVWIMGEDLGPELGCYGDSHAITPNIDRLARQGVRFTRAFTHAPVCAPSRSGLVTGRIPTSIGSHHMRSTLLKPPPLFTESLRKTGYLICWPTKTPYGKTDFNFAVPTGAFDVVTDWTQAIPRDRPFFGFFNITTSHESQIRAGFSDVAKPRRAIGRRTPRPRRVARAGVLSRHARGPPRSGQLLRSGYRRRPQGGRGVESDR